MTANIQISGKANNGIIFVVGGDTYEEFRANLIALLGSVQSADETIVEAARLVIPPSVGQGLSPGTPQQQAAQQQTYQPPPQQQYAQTQPAQQYQDPYQQANNVIQGQFGGQVSQVPDQRPAAGPPPGGQGAPLCPVHQAPAKWVPPGFSQKSQKSYAGFWSCAVSARGDRSCKID